MKLKNRTAWPDHFLRRLVSWCAKTVGVPVKSIRVAEFGSRTHGAFNGRAWSGGRIRVVIGPTNDFPAEAFLYPGRKTEAFRAPAYEDQLEALVGVTAHELEHIRGYIHNHNRAIRKRRIVGERHTRHAERTVIEQFRAERTLLLLQWHIPPTESAKTKLSLTDKRKRKADADMARWLRKLALAKTKVRKLKTRVRYYEKKTQSPIAIAACTKGGE